MRRTLANNGLTFEKATPLVRFYKALKRPRSNAGPASTIILIALCACVRVCVCTNAYSSHTVDRTVFKFCLPPKTRVQVSDGTSLGTL